MVIVIYSPVFGDVEAIGIFAESAPWLGVAFNS